MRELVFTLDYEPGCNAVADALAAHPDARVRSLSLHATDESLWRVDHATGSPEALADLEAAFTTADYYADCLATEHCGATRETEVLDQTAETLVLYSYWERTQACESVPHMALDHLGEGLLFETRHRERAYTWRVVHPGDGDVRGFLDDVGAAVAGCAALSVDRLTSAEAPDTGDGLPPEQREAMLAAVEAGYYETPRESDAGDLAADLGVPRSTLNYRLRRAEAYLAREYAGRVLSSEAPAPSI